MLDNIICPAIFQFECSVVWKLKKKSKKRRKIDELLHKNTKADSDEAKKLLQDFQEYVQKSGKPDGDCKRISKRKLG